MRGALSIFIYASLAASPVYAQPVDVRDDALAPDGPAIDAPPADALPLGPGTWIPTEGPAGERPIQGIAAGGDGAVYAASQGVVYRLVPGEPWIPIGRYTPEVGYDPFEGIRISGDFPADFLENARVELNQALVPHLGLDDERPEDENVLDMILGVFEAYTTEADPAPESIYAVHRVARADDGVWIATGGGLFKATATGVQGPITDVSPVLDVMQSRTEVLFIGPAGLRRLTDGRAEPWRQFIAQTLSRVDGRAAFIAEGTSWWDDGQVGPRRIAPPTGIPRRIASGGQLLFVATDLAVYRREGEAWTLCGRLPETPQRMISDDAVLVAVGEQAVYATDKTCARWTVHAAPWMTDMRFTDVAMTRAGVWGATSDGVFLLGPRDHDLMTATAVEGFQRQLRQLPSWPVAFDAAQKTLAVDRATNSFGARPLWRMLLPTVLFTVGTWPGRQEREPTFLGGTPQVVTLPRDYYQLSAWWEVDMGALTQLFAGDSDPNVEDEVDELDSVVSNAAPTEDTFDDQVVDDDVVASADLNLLDVDGDVETGDVVAVSALEIAANDRTLLRRDRHSLYLSLRRLYRERLRLMYRLFLRQSNVDPQDVLRLQALDARLDAYTGGAWSRALESAR